MSVSEVSPAPSAAAVEERAMPASALVPALMGSRARWIAVGVAVVAGLIFFAVADDGWLLIANVTLIAALATLGLNVLSGYAGQVSLGIAFFMEVGAYTAAVLGGAPATSNDAPIGFGLPFFLWLPAAGVVAALFGALVGPTALRLKGFYLGIVSLALVFVGQYVANSWVGVTKSRFSPGRSMPQPSIAGASFSQTNYPFGQNLFGLTTGQQYFLLLVPIVIVAGLFVANVARSRAGRAFQAVRDNEAAAAIMGVNLFQAKMGAFILSAFVSGVAGALYAAYPSAYTSPTQWSLVLSIEFVAAIIIGGVASVWGSVLGAAFVFALPLIINRLSLLPQSADATGLRAGDLNAIIYGLLIVFFLLFEPGGIVALVRRRRFAPRLSLRSRRARKGGESAPEANTTP
jgi:branched-chain amino acid transport system permease protein